MAIFFRSRFWCFLASCFVGTVFIVSATSHFTNPVGFFEDLLAYEIVGASTAVLITLILPPMMFVSGLSIINRLASKNILRVTGLFLLVFLLAQSSALARGLNIDCGCFGRGSHEVGWFSIAFTSFCLLGNLMIYWEKSYGKPESLRNQPR